MINVDVVSLAELFEVEAADQVVDEKFVYLAGIK
jgi:hypothetical protein